MSGMKTSIKGGLTSTPTLYSVFCQFCALLNNQTNDLFHIKHTRGLAHWPQAKYLLLNAICESPAHFSLLDDQQSACFAQGSKFDKTLSSSYSFKGISKYLVNTEDKMFKFGQLAFYDI